MGTWKVVIADDEKDVHTLTKTVLQKFNYKGKALEFISTYSGKETLEALKEHDDVVLLLLDVVMEEDDAGLQVVKKLREDLHNHFTQVVLRTGQAGSFPEKEVVENYAINDYKEKTELTSKKLLTTVITAIRSYENMQSLQQNKEEIENLNHDLRKMIKSFDKSVIASKVDLEGNIIYVSSAFCQTFGYSPDELLGKSHEALRHPASDPKVLMELNHAYAQHEPWKGEILYLTKSHEIFWAYLKRFPEVDKEGNFLNFTNIFTNITNQKEIEDLNKEIIDTQKEVVFKMGAIAEARSKETGMHVRRVAEYSKIFAQYYGLSKEEANILKQASPMHDIGKVAIPDNILNKTGKLTVEEFEIMKSHANLGYEMLKNSKKAILSAAAIVAHEHHEKWDGNGYPQGLKGEDIHIYGRITAVADVFDALGSKRCYKDAWEDERIYTLLKNEKGKHFEPKLIDIFFEHLDEFLHIRDTFKDEDV